MISAKELERAISDLENAPTSLANCEKLATFYFLYDRMQSEKIKTVKATGGSEFMRLIYNKDINEVLKVIDELMQTIDVLQNKLYVAAMEQIERIT